MSIPSTFPYGVTTYSYTRSMAARPCLKHLAGLGFRRFDLVMQPGHAWPDEWAAPERAEFRRFTEGEGLELITLNVPNADLNLTSVLPDVRRTTMDVLLRVIDLAGDLRAAKVIVGPGKTNALFPAPREQLLDWMYAGLDMLCERARLAGTGLLLENMPFSFLPDMASLTQAVDRFGAPDIELIYDLANATFIGEEVADGMRLAADRLYMVHCSDTGLARFRHDAVGDGVVDFDKAAAALLEIETACPPLLEIITDDPDRHAVDSAIALMRRGFGLRG